jgi:hypothetical protein
MLESESCGKSITNVRNTKKIKILHFALRPVKIINEYKVTLIPACK